MIFDPIEPSKSKNWFKKIQIHTSFLKFNVVNNDFWINFSYSIINLALQISN